MERRLLGSSELKVSVLGLGCWPLGGGPGWGDTDEAESIATVHAALDLGINFFDTAEMYNEGRSEEILGRALKGRRADALIATKVSPESTEPAILRAHCEASLRRLQTDHIDLYQVHWPVDGVRIEEAFVTLADLQAAGKIRTIGVSNHGAQQLVPVLAIRSPIVSNQLCYSLLSRAIEFEILPLCTAQGISVIAYMALMQGLLVGLYNGPEDVQPFGRAPAIFAATNQGRGMAARVPRPRPSRRLPGYARSLQSWESPWLMWLWPGSPPRRAWPVFWWEVVGGNNSCAM